MQQGAATSGEFDRTRLGAGLSWGRRLFVRGWHRPSWRAIVERELAERAGFQWLAVAFAAGCLVYFALPREPGLTLLIGATIAMAVIAVFGYRRDTPWRIAAIMAACLAGGSAAKIRVDRLDAPQIERRVFAELTGRVVDRDSRAERRPRIVLDSLRADQIAPAQMPDRIRLTISSKAELPPLGARVSARAQLMPIAGPALPGGYDPHRAAYFEGIGGSGFALGGWTLLAEPNLASPGLFVGRIRASIVARIMANEPGEAGAVAAALLVGERSGLSAATNESLRLSGLAHILSISGLHMMLIAGTAFFVVRAALALSPRLALSRPIRKWAAMAALVVVTAYFALSGGGAATVRAYVMAAVMFSAMLLDRPAISMRNLALAAFAVLALEPESITEPGFQMSFAAVAALIAGWEAWRDRRSLRLVDPDALPGLRIARIAGAALTGVLLTSLVAGLATAPFSAYHFERVATYSLLGNLLAAPLVSAVIMPFGLLTLVMMPFGLEALPLSIMARGIDLLLWISDGVARLPGAEVAAPLMSPASLLAITAGMLWLCLWRHPWRLFGLTGIGVGLLFIPILAEPADVLVSPDGLVVAVRGSDGILRISGSRPGSYTIEQFLDEEAGPARDPASLRANVRCDDLACLLIGENGLAVSHVLDPAAFAVDCGRAGIIATPLIAPVDCAAPLVVDARQLERFGAHAIRVEGRRLTPTFEVATDRSASPRPWQAGIEAVRTAAPGTISISASGP